MAIACAQKVSGFFEEPVVIKLLSTPLVSFECVEALAQMMRKLFLSLEIQKCTEESLDFTETSSKKILLVLPDAMSVSHIKISAALQERIKFLCKEGHVKILGVCAGAFYLSQDVEYKGVKIEHTRVLTLFSGLTQGPFYVEEKEWEIRAERVQILATQKFGSVTVIGGASFVPKQTQDHEIDSKPLALCETKTGNHVVALATSRDKAGIFSTLLLGSHFEFEAQHSGFSCLKTSFPEKKESVEKIQHALAESKDFRLCAMHGFLQELGFK